MSDLLDRRGRPREEAGATRPLAAELGRLRQQQKAIERLTTDGVCVFSTAGVLRRANGVARRLLGIGPAESDLQAGHAGCLVDDRGNRLSDDLNPLCNAIREGLPISNAPVLWQRPDGLVRSLTMSFEPYPAGDDPEAGREVVVVVRDADDAARLAGQVSQLRSDRMQQQHLLNLVFDNVDSGVALVDNEDHVAIWNFPFATLWGLEPYQGQPGPTTDELLERVAWDFAAEQRQQFDIAMAAARESFEPVTFEVATAAKYIHVYTCRLAGGRRLWAVRDLTERRRMTRELEAAKEQAEADRNLLQLVFANVESGIFALSADGRVLSHNPVFSRMWGLDDEWLSNGPTLTAVLDALRPLFHAERFGEYRQQLHDLQAVDGAGALDLETADGRSMVVYTAPLGDGGRLYSCRDTTARRRLERSLAARNEELARLLETQRHMLARLEEANRQLAESDRLKSEFLANTSHELRTPLNCILGYLGLIIDGVYESDEDVKSYALTAHKNADHLAEVIADLLDVAKIESGRMELRLEPVVLWLAIEEIAQSVMPQVTEKGIDLVLPPIDLDLTVLADSGRLRQVLLNVIGNAVKFTSTGEVRIATTVDGPMALIQVTDTGIGIPLDKQDKVFEKFVQADGSMQRAFGGTGLGLSITRSLLELMDGSITLRSEGEGHGTEVTVALPLG